MAIVMALLLHDRVAQDVMMSVCTEKRANVIRENMENVFLSFQILCRLLVFCKNACEQLVK